jgi:5'-3' exonuclease
MGIDNLWPFLAKKAPEAFSVVPLAQLRHARVAIDMNFHVFRMFKRCGCDNEATVTELQLLFDFIRAHSIRAVFVFDGNTAGLKARAHAARALASEKAHARVAEYQGTLAAMEDAATAAEIAAVELVEAEIRRRREAQAQSQAQAPPVLADSTAADPTTDPTADTAPDTAAGKSETAEPTADTATDTADMVEPTADPAEPTADMTADVTEDMADDMADVDMDTDGADIDVDATYDEVARPPPAEDVVAAAPTPQQMHAVRELLGKASNNAKRPHTDLMQRLWRTAGEYGVVVRADDDGEKLVAQLCARGVVDYAVSGDGDTLAFGATQLIRHLDPRYATASVISLPVIIRSLRLLNMAGFVNLAILSGNDMHKLPGIGIVKALQLLNKFGTPEAALACAVEFRVKPPPPDFDVAAIRDRFTSPCLCGADIDVGPAVSATAASTTAASATAASATAAVSPPTAKPSILSMLLKSGKGAPS